MKLEKIKNAAMLVAPLALSTGWLLLRIPTATFALGIGVSTLAILGTISVYRTINQ